MVCKGAIQGRVSIVMGEGSLTADKKFIGPTLDITTDQGDIKIASCYSYQSKFITRWGNMVLKGTFITRAMSPCTSRARSPCRGWTAA